METEKANNPVVKWLQARPVLAKTIFWSVVLGIPLAGAVLLWREIHNGHLLKVTILMVLGVFFSWQRFGPQKDTAN